MLFPDYWKRERTGLVVVRGNVWAVGVEEAAGERWAARSDECAARFAIERHNVSDE
jgi:hypothetical protein